MHYVSEPRSSLLLLTPWCQPRIEPVSLKLSIMPTVGSPVLFPKGDTTAVMIFVRPQPPAKQPFFEFVVSLKQALKYFSVNYRERSRRGD